MRQRRTYKSPARSLYWKLKAAEKYNKLPISKDFPLIEALMIDGRRYFHVYCSRCGKEQYSRDVRYCPVCDKNKHLLCYKDEEFLKNHIQKIKDSYTPELKERMKRNQKKFWENASPEFRLEHIRKSFEYRKHNRVSNFHKEVIEFIKSISDVELKINDRLTLPKTELDIYIPSKKIAIECNGTYWHCNLIQKDKNYHYNKSKLCEKEDILLITIWEHDWYNENTKAFIKNYLKLCLSHRPSINELKQFNLLSEGSLRRDFYNLPLGTKINHKEEVFYIMSDSVLIKKPNQRIKDAPRIYTSGIDVYDHKI